MKFPAIAFSSLLFASAAAGADIPRTLFEMAGAKPDPATLSNTTVLIIDAQREYVDGALPLNGVHAALEEIERLLVRARKAGTPIIHVRHRGRGGVFDPATPYFDIVSALQPREGEPIVEKNRVSAFTGTSLEDAIRRSGRKNLVIVGFMTHNCVSSTARDARDLGYAPTIVARATATRDLPDGRGGIIPAHALQAASLAELGDGTAAVVQSTNDIKD